MRPVLSLKTLLRSPLKTIFTFLLIAAAAFAVFSRVTDYAITTRETEHAISFYNGVAALDNTLPDTSLTAEVGSDWSVSFGVGENKPWPTDAQLEAFSALPGVTLTDTRYMTAGLVEGYRRILDQYGVNSKGKFIIEGIYLGYEEAGDFVELAFDDVKVLAGELTIDPGEPTIIPALAVEDMVFSTNPHPAAFFEEVQKGSRCLVSGSYNIANGDELMKEVSEKSFIIIDGLPDNYLETKEFAYYQTYINAINQELYAYDIVYTSDMRAIPRVNERNIKIAEGRPLMAGDTDGCVVSTIFMEEHGHAIGDRINVELGDKLFMQSGISGVIDPRYESSSDFIKSVELEIVGVYRLVDNNEARVSELLWSYTFNTIFVSNTLLPIPVPADHKITVGDFSVLIEDARDIEKFLEAAKPLVEEMDVAMRFSDGGWMGIKDSFETGSLTAFLTTALYLSGAALALLLSVYLYIGRSRVTYAIMRALGVPGENARNSIALPLGVLSVFAIPVGGIAGLVYTSSVITDALKSVMTVAPAGYIPDTSLPVGIILLCLLCVLIFITATTSFFLWKMRKTPPLELLQGDVIQVAVNAGAMPAAAGVLSAATERKIIQLPVTNAGKPPRRKYSASRQVTAYIFRHMRRGLGKTVISLSLALVLTTGVGLLVMTRLTYQDAFHSIDVKGRAYEFSSSAIAPLSNSDLINDFFCSGDFGVLVNGIDLGNSITLTNDLYRYLKNSRINDYHIDYAEGYNASFFSGTGGALCLLGSEIADMLGISPGDDVTLLSSNMYFALNELQKDNEDDILATVIERESITYKVAGIIDSGVMSIDSGIFAAVNRAAENLYSQPFPLKYSDFTLSDNEKLSDLTKLLNTQRLDNIRHARMASFFIDSAELDNIRFVRDLLILLFPIAVTAAVLIGSAAPGLIIVQSAKTAALMRVLGVTKKRTRCMLMFEQVGLCVVGLSLVAGGLALYNSGLFAGSAETLAISGALYLSGCFCAAFWASVHVTRRRVLELIQVKE